MEGHPSLLSSGAPDSQVHHRTVTVHVWCAISFHTGHIRPLLLGAGWRTGHSPVHTGQSGAPSRSLELATCRALIARPAVGANAVGSPDSPVHHRTSTVHVRCVISFHIRHIRPLLLGAGWRTGHCPVHTGQSDVPNRPLLRATRRPLRKALFTSI